ncbi:MAG: hypothetical protein AB7S92_20740 [Parvibaculaceae bacterium]
MTLERLALCFTLLLVFPAVDVGAAKADFLNDVKRGARKTGQAIERGAKKVGRAVGEGVEDAGDAIGRGARKLGRDMERGYCRVTEDRDCRVNGSVGRDRKGTYAYDPKNPKKKYRGDETDPRASDRDRQLSRFAAYVNTKEMTPSEYEDRDVHKFRRFLLPNAKLGEGYPEKEKLVPPTRSGEIRPCCRKGGGGGFLADRLDKTELRFYGGTDYLTMPGDPVYATIDGWVEMRKDPRKEFQGLVLRDKDGYRVSLYFVEVAPAIDKALKDRSRFEVKAGETVLGKAQDLHAVYPADVPNHIHVVMSDPKGNPIDPSGRILLERAPKSVPDKMPVKKKAPETAAKP